MNIPCPFCDHPLVVVCAKCKVVHAMTATVAGWALLADVLAAQRGHPFAARTGAPVKRSPDLSGTGTPACPKCQQTLLLLCPACLRCRMPDRSVADLAQRGGQLGVDLAGCFSSNGKEEGKV